VVFVACLTGPASALTCDMTPEACTADCAELSISFDIDPAQFAAPHHPNEPPRRQTTAVAFGDTRFIAEAIMMKDGVRGFYEATAISSRLMIVQAGGNARLVVLPGEQIWTGHCDP